jgi:hypothetical protein
MQSVGYLKLPVRKTTASHLPHCATSEGDLSVVGYMRRLYISKIQLSYWAMCVLLPRFVCEGYKREYTDTDSVRGYIHIQ